jgi:hypothetical protein
LSKLILNTNVPFDAFTISQELIDAKIATLRQRLENLENMPSVEDAR